MAVVGALVGLVILFATVLLGNRIENRMLRYLAAAAGILAGLAVAGMIAGDEAAKAGEYMVYIAIPVVIVKTLFFKKSAA
jgi:hypothetical protein